MPAQTLKRAFEAAIDDVSPARRTVTARINTGIVDRYRTVIVPSGGDLRAFQRTPTVLWEHGMDPTRGRQPIGHCTSIKYRRLEDDILAVTQFRTDPYSDQIFECYRDGTLTSWSVDFLPDFPQTGRPTPDEVRAHPEWSQAETIFRKWELTGYSAVSYPGNPDALTIAVERGLWVPEEVRRSLAAAPKRAMAEGSGAAGGDLTEGRYITKDGDEFVVHAEDGKVLGKHKTKADAEAQLAAVEAHKHDERSLDGVRSFTETQLVSAVVQALMPLVDLADQRIRDTADLVRGRI